MSDMQLYYAIGGAVIWWTIAVICIGAVHNVCDGIRDFLLVIPAALLWPVALPFLAVALIYIITVKSTGRIRVDLRNQGILREFNAWMKEREASNGE